MGGHPGQRRTDWRTGSMVGSARRPWPLHLGDADEDSLSTRSAKLHRGAEYRWWLQRWNTFDKRVRGTDENTLPRRRNDLAKLPEVELLKPLVFGSDTFGNRRFEVARETQRVSASDHIELCKHLSRVFVNDRRITLLPRFSRLADAGMAAMDLIAKALSNESGVALTRVAALPAAA